MAMMSFTRDMATRDVQVHDHDHDDDGHDDASTAMITGKATQ